MRAIVRQKGGDIQKKRGSEREKNKDKTEREKRKVRVRATKEQK